jgi:ribosomal protein S18 acetylase RimI-like enzyme
MKTIGSDAMQIRKMLIDDYEDVYALWMSCVGMGLNNLDDSKEGISRFLKKNPDTCFIAIDENNLIGVIMVGNDGRRGYIYHTAVHPEYRKQGLGTKLVDTALQALRDEGINKVALVVFDRNDKGNAFWERRGFTKREDLVYRNQTLTEMVRIDT